MAGLARVHVEGGGAGRGQGGGDFAGDVAGLAHAGGDHPAAAAQDGLAGLLEGLAQPVGDGLQRLLLDLEDAAAARHQGGGIDGTGGQGRLGHADATQRK